MREIKFRAWDKKHKRWANADDMLNLVPIAATRSDSSIVSLKENDEWVPSQYTGLNDKNGNDIYEGDVVEFCEPQFEDNILRCVVEFQEGYFSAKRPVRGSFKWYPLSMLEELEVLGNIYENPELME